MATEPDARTAPANDRLPIAVTVAWWLGIVATAIALRCWRLSWGLAGPPGRLGFPDEGLMWVPYLQAFTPLSWASFDTEKLNYPTLYGYLVGFAAVAARGFDLVTIPPGTLALFRAGKEAILLARCTAVATSLVTVGLVGVAATRMYSQRIGLAAAALAAVLPFEVAYAHLASPDVLLATCTVLTALVAWEAARSSRSWFTFAAGAVAGATTATKYTGLAMIVPALWSTLENGLRGRVRFGRWLLLVACVFVGFALFFAIACPPCVMHSDLTLAALENHRRITSTLYFHLHNNFLTASMGWHTLPYVYQLVVSLPFTLGWPLHFTCLYGVGLALRRRTLPDRMLLATMVPYFLVIGASKVVYPRYLLPLLPVLVILAARALVESPRRHVAVVVLATVWIYSAGFAASHVARFSLDQQREVADWIAEAIPAGQSPRAIRVGAPKMMLDYFRLAAPLAKRNLPYVELVDGHWFEHPPEFFVLPQWYEIAIDRDVPTTSEAALDLARLRSSGEYVLAKRWESTYLNQSLYTALDPALAGDLWQGEIGFSVYARRDVPLPAP